ncbi:hypothetical protein [Polyangium mundeleinium]|uniref:Uncharacterized protein n=1 Tax=Polyangium mundeleinium TaxID=2995306 RepID=A0ABT5ERW0_9BACT|nr:hypothetical protein [Polyangium mundeleinium]MDC0744516.1 hypothetical protein [Polyangium mundeleinium]
MRRAFAPASALVLVGCTTGAPPPPTARDLTPAPSASIAAPAPTAKAAPVALSAQDSTFVEVRTGYGTFCARTERGFLHCWGLVVLPGEMAKRTHYRPTLMPGFTNLKGFTILKEGQIVGWNAAGTVIRLVREDPTKPFYITRGFLSVQPTPEEIAKFSLGVPAQVTSRIVAGSHDCLLSDKGEVFCQIGGDFTNSPFLRVPVPPMRTLADTTCGVGVDGGFHCWNLDRQETTLLDKPAPGYGVASVPLKGPVAEALLARFQPGKPQVCARRPDGTVFCHDWLVDQKLREIAEGKLVTRLFTLPGQSLCVSREDGVSRCTCDVAQPCGDTQTTFDVLPSVDASLGVAVSVGNICALGKDHRVRCFGERMGGRLGDGQEIELERATKAPGITGASEISADDGVVCARFGTTRVSCWGAIAGVEHVPRHDLVLPEPAVDAIVGGVGLCVRGAKSGRWYCRNKAFFPGNLKDDFTLLVDTGGAPVKDVTLSIDNGSGIAVAKRSGGAGRFHYAGSPKPLRVQWIDPKDELANATYLDLSSNAILADGTAILQKDTSGDHERVPAKFRAVKLANGTTFLRKDTSGDHERVPGKFRAVLRSAHCAVDASARLLCMGAPEGPKVVLTDVADVDADCVSTTRGEVFCFDRMPKKKGEIASFRRIEGLPDGAIVQLGGDCGRTREGEVYCWGSVFDLGDRDPVQRTPVEIAKPESIFQHYGW